MAGGRQGERPVGAGLGWRSVCRGGGQGVEEGEGLAEGAAAGVQHEVDGAAAASAAAVVEEARCCIPDYLARRFPD